VDPANGLTVELVLPWHDGERRYARYEDPDAHVVLHSRTDHRIKVWEDWNSWGYYCLRLELRDETGKTYQVRKRARPWTANLPQATTIARGGTNVLNLRLGQQIWHGLPTRPAPPEGWAPVEMRAIYENDCSTSREAEDDPDWGPRPVDGVWTGRAVSAWVPVYLWEGLPDPVWSKFDDLEL